MFDSDVDDFLKSFIGNCILEELLLISDGNSNGGSCVYSVSGVCRRFSGS